MKPFPEPTRVWINAASIWNPYHAYHGRTGIAWTDDHGSTKIYFPTGDLSVMDINPFYLERKNSQGNIFEITPLKRALDMKEQTQESHFNSLRLAVITYLVSHGFKCTYLDDTVSYSGKIRSYKVRLKKGDKKIIVSSKYNTAEVYHGNACISLTISLSMILEEKNTLLTYFIKS